MVKEYTFVTTYIVQAPQEVSAREFVAEKVKSLLSAYPQCLHVTEFWTKLIDVSDVSED